MGSSDLLRTYPPGVPCWIDNAQPDAAAAARFYGGLFGWAFQEAGPAGAPGSYLIGTAGGREVAAIRQARDTGSAPAPGGGPGWLTYISVAGPAEAARSVTAAGGTAGGELPGTGAWGRTLACTDPAGAAFGLWPPGRLPGAQLVNVAGAWNFSHLHTTAPEPARRFYAGVFGWEYDDVPGGGTSIRVPGYGDHLAATVDPGIRARQAGAPPGFADVIAGIQPVGPDEAPHWHVTFTVADRDASAAAAEGLGAAVLGASETPWARLADIRDPQGASFTISQFRPPG